MNKNFMSDDEFNDLEQQGTAVYIDGPKDTPLPAPAPQKPAQSQVGNLLKKALGAILSRRQPAAGPQSEADNTTDGPMPDASQTFDLPDTGPQDLGLDTDKQIMRIGVIQNVLERLMAGAASGTLGVAESLWRTPEAAGRGIQGVSKTLGAVPEWIPGFKAINPDDGVLTKGFEAGGIHFYGASDVADRISEVQKLLPQLHPAFRRNAEDNAKLDQGVREVAQYVQSRGRRGRPARLMDAIYSPTAFLTAQGANIGEAVANAVKAGRGQKIAEVMKDPGAWAGNIGQAVPSLLLAFKSGGSLGFMGWMEGMDTANSAAQFEKKTGLKIDDNEFMSAVLQAAVINSVLEKAGMEETFKILKGGTARVFRSIQQAGKSALTEGFTELVQEFNSNLAQKISFDAKKDLMEGLAASFMGGFGSGGATSAVRAGSEYMGDIMEGVQAFNKKLGEGGFASTEDLNPFDKFKKEVNDKAQEPEQIAMTIKSFYEENKDALLEQYAKENGKVVSADRAKKLFESVGYTGEDSAPYQKYAGDLIKRHFDNLLKESEGTGKDVVVMTGGTGSGKSTAVDAFESEENVAAIFDVNLTDAKKNGALIEQILESGLKPKIEYILRDPENAFLDGVVERAMNEDSPDFGRVVSLKEHMAVHEKAKQTFQELVEKYGDKAEFNITDNRGEPGQEKELSFDELKNIDYNYPKIEESLKNELEQRTDIPENLKRAFLKGERGREDSQSPPESSQVQRPLQKRDRQDLQGTRSQEVSSKNFISDEEAERLIASGEMRFMPPDLAAALVKGRKTKDVVREQTGQTDTSEEVESTEKLLLKKQLKDKASGARYGFREGRAQAKRAFLAKMAEAGDSIQARKQALAEYIRENAPKDVVGPLLRQAKEPKTDNQLLRAMSRVDDIIENKNRQTTIKEISKLFQKADSARNIAVEYRDLIESIENEINFKNRRIETIQRLRRTKAWLDKQIAAGKDVMVPRRIYEAVQSLDKTSIHDFGLDDLYILYDTLDTMMNLGKVKQQNRASAYIAEKGQIEKELLEAPTEKIETVEEKKKPIGGELEPSDKLVNLMRRGRNLAQAVDLNITPMDTIFDIFDKGAGYVGSWYRNFKRRTDINFSNYLQEKWPIQDKAVALVKELKLDERNFERIGVHAANIQEGGRQKLLNSGMTEKEIDAIKLTDNEQKYYDFMRENLDALFPRIQEMMAAVFNEEIGQVKNYFSFMTDFEALNELEAAQRVFDEEGRQRLQTKPNLGFTKERVGVGKQKIRLNAHKVFMSHIDNALYAIHMTYTNKMLSELIESPDLEKKVGLRGKTIIKQWLDLVNRKGGVSGQQQIEALDFLRKHYGVAVLGLKLSSAMKQPIALLNGAELIGQYAFRGAQAIASDKRWRKLIAQLPEIRERIGDDPSFLESSDNKAWRSMQETGMAPLKQLDRLTAASVAAGAYMKTLDKRGVEVNFDKIDKEAMQYAQQIVRRSQSTSTFKDVPLAVSRGKLGERFENRSIAKTILQFQTFMLSQWAILRRDLPNDLAHGRFQEAGTKALFYASALATEVFVSNLSKQIISSLFGGDNKDKEFLKQYFMQALQSVPFVSQAVSAASYGSIPVPLLSAMTQGFDNFKNYLRSKSPKAKAKWMRISLLESMGGVFGVTGTMQLSQILRKQKVKKEKSYGGYS